MIPPAAIAIASRIGWKGAAMIGLAGFGLVQTVRIEGALWLDGFKSDLADARDDLAACERDRAALVAAQADAKERAVQARISEQQRLSDIARNADEKLEEARRNAFADARAYIERMRPQAYRGSGGTVAAPGDRIAESGDGPDPTPIVDDPVIVEANDVLICTDTVLRLEAVQEWAAGLNVSE